MKHDVLNTLLEFFKTRQMDNIFNRTLVTLIPKHNQERTIREYKPISCCTIVYKIISKVMATRLSRVLRNIISRSQASFVPG